MRKLAESWLAYAQADLSAARQLSASDDVGGLAAFHVQQAIEKTLKALLVLNGQDPPRTHDLPRLWGQMEGRVDPPENLQLLRLANEFYIEARYPAGVEIASDPAPTQAELSGLIEYAQAVFVYAQGRIRSSIDS